MAVEEPDRPVPELNGLRSNVLKDLSVLPMTTLNATKHMKDKTPIMIKTFLDAPWSALSPAARTFKVAVGSNEADVER